MAKVEHHLSVNPPTSILSAPTHTGQHSHKPASLQHSLQRWQPPDRMGPLLLLASALLCSCKSADLLPSPLLSGSVDILHRFLFLTWCFTFLSRPKTSMQAEWPTHNVSNVSSIILNLGLDLTLHLSRWLVFLVHRCFAFHAGFGLKTAVGR